MNKVEKIKAELERRIAEIRDISQGYIADKQMSTEYLLLHEFLSYIDSLSDTEKDFGIKNVGTVWHDANNVPTKKELCLIMLDSNNGLTLNNVEVVIANPLARRFVTCSYPHNTGKQYTVQGETPIQVDVYHSCRDYIPFSDVDKWAYISDIFNLNNSQEEPVSNDLEEAASQYPSIICHISPQWKSEVENVFKAGAQWQKEQMVEEACKWLELHDSYAVPTNIKVRDLKEHLSSK